MKKLTILFDADDTVENLSDCWIAMLNERYGTSVTPEDVHGWDISLAFPTLTKEQVFGVLHDDELWRRITPIPGSVEVLQKLYDEGHQLYMVTASSYHTCKTKVERLLELFPFLDWEHIIFACNKQMVRGDVLIDDAPHNLVGGEYAKILFDRPHNRSFDHVAHDALRVNTWEEIDQVIMVFYKSPPPYHPQMTVGEKNHTKGKAVGKQAEDVHSNRSYGNYTLVESPDGNMKYPASIWRFPKPHPSVALHATEKPVDLLRYAIRTYTDRNAIVLDNCCGTGSTLIAAKLEGRRYIGIDNGVCDKKKSPYYGMPWAQVAQIRLEAIDHEPADEPERHRPLGEGTIEGVCTPSGVSA